MDADGGKPKAVTGDKLNNFVSSWSRDGRWVYFSKGSDNDQIWKVAPQGGEAIRLTQHRGSAPMESPDGKTLFFTKASSDGRTTSLWRMPAAGGAEQQIVPELFRYNYAVTAAGVYYSTSSTPDRPSGSTISNSPPEKPRRSIRSPNRSISD